MANSKDKRRYINTTIWLKSWFLNLSHEAKFVYLYLLTCPSSNLAGVLEVSEDFISFHTKANASSALKELEETGEIIRQGDWIGIIRHPVFQKWQTNPKIGIGIFIEVHGLPKWLTRKLRESGYMYPPLMTPENWEREYVRLLEGPGNMRPDDDYLNDPPFEKEELT